MSTLRYCHSEIESLPVSIAITFHIKVDHINLRIHFFLYKFESEFLMNVHICRLAYTISSLLEALMQRA